MKTEPDFKTVKFNQIDKNVELENSSDVFKLDFSLKGWIRKSDQIKGTVIRWTSRNKLHCTAVFNKLLTIWRSKISDFESLTDEKKLSEEKQKIVHEYLDGKRDIIPSDYQVLDRKILSI